VALISGNRRCRRFIPTFVKGKLKSEEDKLDRAQLHQHLQAGLTWRCRGGTWSCGALPWLLVPPAAFFPFEALFGLGSSWHHFFFLAVLRWSWR